MIGRLLGSVVLVTFFPIALLGIFCAAIAGFGMAAAGRVRR